MGDFWQKLAKRSQSNLYFALAFLPRARREAFRDVYRFLRTADDVVDSGIPADQALGALEAWKRELDAVYAGTATHPIAQRLTETVRRFGLTRAHFDIILGALAEDVRGRRFETQRELEGWCEAQSSTLGYLCLEILGADNVRTRAYARDLGVALQLANILRDVAEDARRGRIYLPAGDLRAAGVRDDEILGGHPGAGYATVAEGIAARARSLVEAARAHLGGEDARRLLVPEIWADVYLALLDELERARWDVWSGRPYLRRRRKLVLAARRWLREERHHVAERLFPASR